LLAGGGLGATLIHLEARPYYPAVRVAAPGEVTYTALLEPESEPAGCEAVLRRFSAPIEQSCAQCRILSASCARSAAEPDGAPSYWVEAKALRIAISGPEANARASCEQVARDLPGSACSKAGHPVGR
jgi:hypothetical protein